MKHYDLIIFDFDGTICDSFDSLIDTFKESYALINVSVTKEDVYEIMRHNASYWFDKLNINNEQRKIVCDYFFANLFKMENVRKTKIFPDALKLLEKLDELNIPYGIITGNVKENVSNILDYHGLNSGKFVDIIGNETYKKPKPDPECINIFLERHNLKDKISSILYIGDADQDFQCANAIGMDSIIVRREKAPKENEVSSLFELIDLIN